MKSNTESQSTSRHTRYKSDEMIRYCPIDVPNQFLFSYGDKFQMYLEGKYSAEKLVQDLNVVARHQRMSKLEQENSRKIEDRRLQQKKIQQRFDVMRNLIQRNIKLRETQKIQNNLKNSRLFSQINYHCEDHCAKIVQKDLLSDRADGVRRFEGVKYRRLKSIKVSPTCLSRQEAEEETYSKHVEDIELRKYVTEYFRRQEEQQFLLDQQKKRKAKLRIVQDRKHKKHFVEFGDNKSYQPSIKDVRLYNYIHGHQYKTFQMQEKGDSRASPRTGTLHKAVHALANFKKSNENLIVTEDFDQSFESVKELQLTNLYKQSIELQQKLLSERRLVHKLSHSKQLDKLVDQIQIQNHYKLN